MGDRIYANIAIHGHIATVDGLEEILNALNTMDLKCSEDRGRTAHLRGFAAALANESSPLFEDDEVNYGDLSTVTEVLQELGIGYERYYDATQGEEPGNSVWYPGDEKETHSGARDISGWGMEKLLEEPDLEAAVRAKVAELKHAAGADLPKFTVSDEVQDYLVVEIGRATVLAA
jgi:hypothetical protein